MARLIVLLISAVLLAAQDNAPPSLLESLENLQNDFDGAMARANATYADRQKALSVDSLLGRLIGEKRDKQNLNERTVKNLLDEVKLFERGSVFTRADCTRLDRDAENVRYRLANELDVYRGYKGMAHP